MKHNWPQYFKTGFTNQIASDQYLQNWFQEKPNFYSDNLENNQATQALSAACNALLSLLKTSTNLNNDNLQKAINSLFTLQKKYSLTDATIASFIEEAGKTFTFTNTELLKNIAELHWKILLAEQKWKGTKEEFIRGKNNHKTALDNFVAFSAFCKKNPSSPLVQQQQDIIKDFIANFYSDNELKKKSEQTIKSFAELSEFCIKNPSSLLVKEQKNLLTSFHYTYDSLPASFFTILNNCLKNDALYSQSLEKDIILLNSSSSAESAFSSEYANLNKKNKISFVTEWANSDHLYFIFKNEYSIENTATAHFWISVFTSLLDAYEKNNNTKIIARLKQGLPSLLKYYKKQTDIDIKVEQPFLTFLSRLEKYETQIPEIVQFKNIPFVFGQIIESTIKDEDLAKVIGIDFTAENTLINLKVEQIKKLISLFKKLFLMQPNDEITSVLKHGIKELLRYYNMLSSPPEDCWSEIFSLLQSKNTDLYIDLSASIIDFKKAQGAFPEFLNAYQQASDKIQYLSDWTKAKSDNRLFAVSNNFSGITQIAVEKLELVLPILEDLLACYEKDAAKENGNTLWNGIRTLLEISTKSGTPDWKKTFELVKKIDQSNKFSTSKYRSELEEKIFAFKKCKAAVPAFFESYKKAVSQDKFLTDWITDDRLFEIKSDFSFLKELSLTELQSDIIPILIKLKSSSNEKIKTALLNGIEKLLYETVKMNDYSLWVQTFKLLQSIPENKQLIKFINSSDFKKNKIAISWFFFSYEQRSTKNQKIKFLTDWAKNDFLFELNNNFDFWNNLTDEEKETKILPILKDLLSICENTPSTESSAALLAGVEKLVEYVSQTSYQNDKFWNQTFDFLKDLEKSQATDLLLKSQIAKFKKSDFAAQQFFKFYNSQSEKELFFQLWITSDRVFSAKNDFSSEALLLTPSILTLLNDLNKENLFTQLFQNGIKKFRSALKDRLSIIQSKQLSSTYKDFALIEKLKLSPLYPKIVDSALGEAIESFYRTETVRFVDLRDDVKTSYIHHSQADSDKRLQKTIRSYNTVESKLFFLNPLNHREVLIRFCSIYPAMWQFEYQHASERYQKIFPDFRSEEVSYQVTERVNLKKNFLTYKKPNPDWPTYTVHAFNGNCTTRSAMNDWYQDLIVAAAKKKYTLKVGNYNPRLVGDSEVSGSSYHWPSAYEIAEDSRKIILHETSSKDEIKILMGYSVGSGFLAETTKLMQDKKDENVYALLGCSFASAARTITGDFSFSSNISGFSADIFTRTHGLELPEADHYKKLSKYRKREYLVKRGRDKDGAANEDGVIAYRGSLHFFEKEQRKLERKRLTAAKNQIIAARKLISKEDKIKTIRELKKNSELQKVLSCFLNPEENDLWNKDLVFFLGEQGKDGQAVDVENFTLQELLIKLAKLWVAEFKRNKFTAVTTDYNNKRIPIGGSDLHGADPRELFARGDDKGLMCAWLTEFFEASGGNSAAQLASEIAKIESPNDYTLSMQDFRAEAIQFFGLFAASEKGLDKQKQKKLEEAEQAKLLNQSSGSSILSGLSGISNYNSI